MTTLQERIQSFQEETMKDIPERTLRTIQEGIEEIRQSGAMEDVLEEGDRAPAFALPNADGETVSSEELLESGPLVVMFYRGEW